MCLVSMQADINETKCELARLARCKDKRDVGIGPEDPTKWWPMSVIDPRSGEPFTIAGAWDFIAEELEKKRTSIKQCLLKKPCGKLAYEFVVSSEQGEIYVKLRLANGKIIGRSFHVSTPRKGSIL